MSDALTITIPCNALVILCGPAASGKTFFARQHFAETQVVSSDRCRAMISDDENDQSISGHAFEIFHAIIAKRLGFGRLTVADSTALSREARADLRVAARAHGVPVHLIAFEIPLERLIERDAARERTVGEEVLRAQAEKFEDALANFSNENYDALWHLDERMVLNTRVALVGSVPPVEV